MSSRRLSAIRRNVGALSSERRQHSPEMLAFAMNELMLVAGFPLVLVVWAAILSRWRRGLELYILYTPFSGAVELFLYPASWPVLIKDLLFAVPAYIGFAMSGEFALAWSGLPRSVGALAFLFVGIVLVQALNPAGPGLLATLIGLKVWLFYLPMLLLGRAYVRDRTTLLRLSRLMNCLIWLPCSIGVLQWLLSLVLGYQYTMSLFYGAAARAATQGFASFNVGLIRIPATFAFPTNYLNYILCMFVPVLGCTSIEADRRWRKIRTVSLYLLCVGGFMTGVRSAFVMIPLMLFGFYMLRRGAVGAIGACLLMSCAFALVLSITRIDVTGLYQMEADLTQHYSREQAGEVTDALRLTWVGRGVGTDTGAARFVADDQAEFIGFEGYYAKAVAEMGIAGCAIVIALQVALLLWWAARRREQTWGTAVQPYPDAIAMLFLMFLIYNYKGAVIALDPANMLYWLFGGILFSLPQVMKRPAGASEATDLSPWNGWPREEALATRGSGASVP
ncbi:MAG: hypothetical protein JO166_01220 [Deltaproteobacteria bacterium]|nr:hypothetical protein [Deltaproteobacteria bacterium]